MSFIALKRKTNDYLQKMKNLKFYKKMKLLIFSSFIAPLFAFAARIDNPLGEGTTISSLLDKIINFLIAVAIPISTIMVLWSAFLFMTSGGDQKKLDQAKATLKWVVAGITLLLLSKGIAYTIRISLGL